MYRLPKCTDTNISCIRSQAMDGIHVGMLNKEEMHTVGFSAHLNETSLDPREEIMLYIRTELYLVYIMTLQFMHNFDITDYPSTYMP